MMSLLEPSRGLLSSENKDLMIMNTGQYILLLTAEYKSEVQVMLAQHTYVCTSHRQRMDRDSPPVHFPRRTSEIRPKVLLDRVLLGRRFPADRNLSVGNVRPFGRRASARRLGSE